MKSEEAGASKRFGSSPRAQRFVAWLTRFVFDWSRMVGRKDAYWVAGGVARFAGRFVSEHKLARANLAAAFPEKSAAERERILSEAWDNLARTMIDYAFLEDFIAAFDPENPGKGPVDFVGLEHVRVLRESGRPGLLFGAHTGNWELPAALGPKLGVRVTGLYRPPANPYVAEEMERRRTFVQKLIVSGSGAARQVASALRHGQHVAIVVDQRIAEGQEMQFLGRPALANPIVGVLARLFDCPVHACRTIRLPNGRFIVEFSPPLDLPKDAAGRVDAAAANVMIHGIIEGWIREYPEQWLWMHDRWRM
jgi:KDO2-lipid IV(A) lauroyltransferase